MTTTSVKLSSPVGDNQSLYFYVKSLPDNQSETTFLRISGKLYSGNTFDSNYEWENFNKIENFIEVKLPITNPGIDSLTINIYGGAIDGTADGCHNQSISWIDGFEIRSSTTSIKLLDEYSISVYPNPSNGEVIINQNLTEFKDYKICDLMGREVKSWTIKDSRIEFKRTGTFLLILESSISPNRMISKKIIIY